MVELPHGPALVHGLSLLAVVPNLLLARLQDGLLQGGLLQDGLLQDGLLQCGLLQWELLLQGPKPRHLAAASLLL